MEQLSQHAVEETNGMPQPMKETSGTFPQVFHIRFKD